MANIFENATRYKFRFKSEVCSLNVEDLWDIKLEQLDRIAVALKRELRTSEEESFITSTSKTKENKILQQKFDVVKYIIDIKLEEQEERKQAAARKQMRQKLLALREEKERQELGSKSLEDIDKMLAELE